MASAQLSSSPLISQLIQLQQRPPLAEPQADREPTGRVSCRHMLAGRAQSAPAMRTLARDRGGSDATGQLHRSQLRGGSDATGQLHRSQLKRPSGLQGHGGYASSQGQCQQLRLERPAASAPAEQLKRPPRQVCSAGITSVMHQ